MHISSQLILSRHLLLFGRIEFGIVCVDGQTTSPPAAVATADSMGPLNPLKGNHKWLPPRTSFYYYSVSPYTSNAFVLYGIFSSRFLITTVSLFLFFFTVSFYFETMSSISSKVARRRRRRHDIYYSLFFNTNDCFSFPEMSWGTF